jgi:hypothetical protein
LEFDLALENFTDFSLACSAVNRCVEGLQKVSETLAEVDYARDIISKAESDDLRTDFYATDTCASQVFGAWNRTEFFKVEKLRKGGVRAVLAFYIGTGRDEEWWTLTFAGDFVDTDDEAAFLQVAGVSDIEVKTIELERGHGNDECSPTTRTGSWAMQLRPDQWTPSP